MEIWVQLRSSCSPAGVRRLHQPWLGLSPTWAWWGQVKTWHCSTGAGLGCLVWGGTELPLTAGRAVARCVGAGVFPPGCCFWADGDATTIPRDLVYPGGTTMSYPGQTEPKSPCIYHTPPGMGPLPGVGACKSFSIKRCCFFPAKPKAVHLQDLPAGKCS